MAANFVSSFGLVLIMTADRKPRWVYLDCVNKESVLQVVGSTLFVSDQFGNVVAEESLENLNYIKNVAEYLGADVVLDMGRKYNHHDGYMYESRQNILNYWYTIVKGLNGKFIVVHLGEIFERLYHYNGVYFVDPCAVRICISYEIPPQYNCAYFNVPKLFMYTGTRSLTFDGVNVETPLMELKDTAESHTFGVIHVTEGHMDSTGVPLYYD